MEVTLSDHKTVMSDVSNNPSLESRSSSASSSMGSAKKQTGYCTKKRCCKALFVIVLIAGIIACIVALVVQTNAVDAGSTAVYSEDVITTNSPELGEEDLALALEAYEDRRQQAIADRVAMTEGYGNEVLWAFSNVPVPRENIEGTVATLETSEKADFESMNLLRLLQYTNEFDDIIIPTLEKILAWPAEGNSKTQYVYWSENHMAMWLCAIQLTHEWYGWPVQDEHDSRIKSYLEQKTKHGYVEFFSSVYMPYTFAALANLYDFSNDDKIRELAQDAAIRLLQDLDLVTNDMGGQFAVAGRNYKEYVESLSHQACTMGWLLTGRGITLNATEAPFGQGPIALATTTLDVSSVLAKPVIQAELVRETGYNRDEFYKEWSALNEYDKQLVAMSMGGYAHPDYVVSLFATLNYYSLWDGKYFKEIKPIRWLPPGILRFSANIASTYGSSTLLHTQIVLHKYKTSMLSTLQDYHKGLNGEQQWPFVATTGSSAIYIATGDYQNSRNPSVHLPFAKQKENVALLVYSPNSDLQLFSRDNLGVTLVWPELSFSESSKEQGNWIVGREDSSYVAVYRSCLDFNGDGLPSCSATTQVWACVVGHEDTHGSYEEFLAVLQEASVENLVDDKGAITASVDADGQTISIEWSQESVGPAKRALIVGVILLVLIIALAIFACIHIEPPDLPVKQQKAAERCGRLKNRLHCLKTKSGASLCLCLILLTVVFSLGLVAILTLANQSSQVPYIIPELNEDMQ